MSISDSRAQLRSSQIVVEPINSNHAQEWDAFISGSKAASCFHWYGWCQTLESALGYEMRNVVARRDQKIVGVFPYAVVQSKLFGSAMTALPFCTYGGPVAEDAQVESELWNFAADEAKTRALRLEVRLQSASTRSLPTLDLYYSFKRTLPEVLDGMSWLPSKRRNMVRRAAGKGLSAHVSQDVDAFFELYAQNARAHGTPALAKGFFIALVKALGDKTDILFVLDANSKPVSCIMNFYFNGEIHAGFAGENSEARALSANDFKYWSLVEHAVSRKCHTFDFGRSKENTGSFEFKRLWGFTPTPLYYEFLLPSGEKLPSTNPNNPKFKAVMAIWSRLPRFIVDYIGPKIIHGLG
jgi:FemAB-related protein (PEP-CTERM system-associated)